MTNLSSPPTTQSLAPTGEPSSWFIVRSSIQSHRDAIRWACLMEAIAPKVGNVFPGRSFHDLEFADFVVAAEVTAEALTVSKEPFCQRIALAVESTARKTSSNVNLGIVLLMAPLVAADQSLAPEPSGDFPAGHGRSLPPLNVVRWRDEIARQLEAVDRHSTQQVFQAIRHASAGSLGTVDEMDVNDPEALDIDLIPAMRLAEHRDRVARQYAHDFADLFDSVVPVLDRSIERCGDWMAGIVDAQIRLLTAQPDSLIVRKCGAGAAEEVQRRAGRIDGFEANCQGWWSQVRELDAWLRRDGNRLNPGTTADLIAAGLYVLLRSRHSTG
ncbi:MAG: triphosphoribosyl-dephospho-CoA synthase [Planctomycetota bacterium]